MTNQKNKISKFYSIFALTCIILCFTNCQFSNETNKDNILQGQITVLTDESVAPILEEEVMVFESDYNAKVNIKALNEAEIIQHLSKDKDPVAFLTRNLTAKEQSYFNSKKIYPKLTPIAKDAVVFIVNKQSKLNELNWQDVILMLKNKANTLDSRLVFDNINSGTCRFVFSKAKLEPTSHNMATGVESSKALLELISKDETEIGVIGLNHIYNLEIENPEIWNAIKIIPLKVNTATPALLPTQNNIAEGKYLLTRELFFINCQSYAGLGMGFASFIAGERGQRIILKSGLLPNKIPTRKINTRKTIINTKKEQ